MEYRLLGPLDVVSGDRSVPLGGPKQRAVLALLLLRANEVVPTDTIVDALWGERPPKTSAAYLQNCVSRLRKALGRDVLETRPPGYVLRASPDDVDARRFERLVWEARTLPDAGRAEALRAALALWRGPALADFAFEEFAQSEAQRLEELRLAAVEERIEAELELGRHAELAGELEALSGAYPSRERLRALQMLALYRAGRQADALRAYQEARLALVEELGIEPGEELKELERQILVHDPSLEPVTPEQLHRAAAPAAVPDVRKTVTVLFADVVGSIGLGESLDPESLRRLMSRFFVEMRAVIDYHGGTVEKFSGDEVMGVFGVPVAHEDDGLRAARAAVEMQRALGALNDELARDWGRRIEMRIGINTGEVVAGDVAEGHAFVTGDAVNVAKRLEQAAAPGEILVGAVTRRLAARTLEVEELEPLAVRGRAAPVPAFRLIGIAEHGPEVGLAAPLAGRVEELALLRSALEESVRERSCTRVVVLGEAGVGKSRLAAELAASLGNGVRMLTGRCVPYGEGATWLPLAELLRQAVGTGDPRERIAARLAGDSDAAVVAERLAGAIGVAAGAGPSSETFWAARRFLEALGRELPLVVLLEDVHWAEPTFLDLVEYVSGWASDAPILLLCLARPELLEVRPEWGEGALTLGPLGEDDARALVETLPERAEVGADALAAVLDTGEGNPLFLEQLLALVAEGELAAVPPTIEALLSSRLDRLDPGERGVLERAAVVGRELWRGAVEALSPEAERETVGARLLALARRRLVHPDRSTLPGEDAFRFHHVLIRDVAYAAIPKAARGELHERLARWLDGRAAELDELVGYHLEQAAMLRAEIGEADTALSEEAGLRLGDAGVRALKRVDAQAAMNLLTRAIALVRDDLRRLELECELGTAIKFSGDMVRADALLEEVAEQARERGHRRIDLRARIEQAWPRLSRGATTAAETLELIDEALPVFGEAGDELAIGRAWHLAAGVNGDLRCMHAAAEVAAFHVLEHYGRSGFVTDGCMTLLAAAACRGPTPVRGAIARCEELLAETRSPVWRSFVLPLLAALEAMVGGFDAARSHLEDAREGRAEFSDVSTLVTSWAREAAGVELLAGAPGAAASILAPACDALRSSADYAWLATNSALLAESLYRQGRVDDALLLACEALEVAPPDLLVARSLGGRVRGKAMARLGRVSKAVEVAREAVELLAATDDLDQRAQALADLAEVLWLDGRVDEASQTVEQARGFFEAKGNVIAADRMRAALPALR